MGHCFVFDSGQILWIDVEMDACTLADAKKNKCSLN